MKPPNILSALVLILCNIILSRVWAKMEAYMTQIKCPTYYPELVKNASCHLNRTAKDSGSLSYFAEFALSEDVSDVKGIYVFSVQRGAHITNYTAMELDYCRVLDSLQTQFLLKMIADELRRVSNFPLQCPFKKDKRYHIDGFTINSKLIPSYAPELNFISDCNIFVKKRKAIQLTIHGRVVRSRSGR